MPKRHTIWDGGSNVFKICFLSCLGRNHKKIKSCWIEEKLIRTSCILTRTTLYGFISNKMSQHFELLVLRDNKFEGKIPQDILISQNCITWIQLKINFQAVTNLVGSPCQDPPLLSGSTPKCIGDMTCMIKDELGFVPVSTMRHTIDLSVINLFGKIPRGLFELIQVQSLNLSFNKLNGKIPDNIGHMVHVESLDI
ncbi:hypothetical protein MTR_7g083800 [Medicago truncatula]|uniref:Non-specific serine/threonine protein kinase n=1 Tax=Medicago truncatula TaxID=3880 RepID=G7KX73_MEDTR|nr:hypothetical protein MTR_7g083800 [Medicago truncatula]